ncbi:hypothetical protein BV22DRAFT_978003, partial [Leucogyrophana mollusca]
RLREKVKPRQVEAAKMAAHAKAGREETSSSQDDDDPTLLESAGDGLPLRQHVEKTDKFLRDVRAGYAGDHVFSKVMEKPGEHPAFTLHEGYLYMKNRGGEEVLCVPNSTSDGKSIAGIIIDQAHTMLGHFSAHKTAD